MNTERQCGWTAAAYTVVDKLLPTHRCKIKDRYADITICPHAHYHSNDLHSWHSEQRLLPPYLFWCNAQAEAVTILTLIPI